MPLIIAADNLNILNPPVAQALLAGAGLGLALIDVLQPELMETVRVIKQVE